MFNIGGGELIVIATLALLVLGPERLPGAARQAGRAMTEVRRMSTSFQRELRGHMTDADGPGPDSAAAPPEPATELAMGSQEVDGTRPAQRTSHGTINKLEPSTAGARSGHGGTRRSTPLKASVTPPGTAGTKIATTKEAAGTKARGRASGDKNPSRGASTSRKAAATRTATAARASAAGRGKK